MRHTIAFAVLLATAAANKELDKAIEDNNAAMVNLALKSGAKANSVDDDGETFPTAQARPLTWSTR